MVGLFGARNEGLNSTDKIDNKEFKDEGLKRSNCDLHIAISLSSFTEEDRVHLLLLL